MLSLLAGGPSLLRCQHIRRRRLGEEEVRARPGGLLRVPASQEGGQRFSERSPPPPTTITYFCKPGMQTDVLRVHRNRTGRASTNLTAGVQESRGSISERERADRRPNTESGSAGQGGRHQESAGLVISGFSFPSLR